MCKDIRRGSLQSIYERVLGMLVEGSGHPGDKGGLERGKDVATITSR